MKKAIYGISILLIFFVFQSCALFSAAGLTSQGQPTKEVQGDLVSLKPSEEIIDHSQWNKLLQRYVDEQGFVDYQGFKTEQALLEGYLNMLSNNAPGDNWSVQELLAYYINTYNAYTVKLIVDNYPLKSIKDINGPWTRGIVPIGNKNLSLGGLENGILRKMNEPRIHFAINCASISCPKLLNEAYTSSKIEEQLDRVTREFILGDKNDLDVQNPKLSSIFNWYKKDFTVNGEVDVIGYINQFIDKPIDSSASISYKNYDWNLNERP